MRIHDTRLAMTALATAADLLVVSRRNTPCTERLATRSAPRYRAPVRELSRLPGADAPAYDDTLNLMPPLQGNARIFRFDYRSATLEDRQWTSLS